MAKPNYVTRERMSNEYEGDSYPDNLKERLAKILKDGNYREHEKKKIIKRKNQIMEEVTYDTLELTFYENPVKTHRPYVTRWSTFTPRADEDGSMMKTFHESSIEDKLKMICTPIMMDIKAYFPIPKSFSKRDTVLAELGFIKHMTVPDWDNVGKAYCDMQNALTFLDDSLIVDSRVRKLYSKKPRVVVTMRFQSHILNKYQLRSIENRKSFKELLEEDAVLEPCYLEECY